MAIPCDLEAEESMLGAMLLSNDAIAKMVDLVRAADFYKPAHGLIFSAMDTLYRRGEKCDSVTVADELQRCGLLESIGDPSIFISLLANTPSIANAGHYGQIVVRHSTARRLHGIAAEARDRLDAWADPYDLIDELQDELANIDIPVTSDRQTARTLDEIVLDADRLAPWVIPGLIRIDWRIVLVAGEGSGKSTLLRQIAACAAQGIHPLRLQPIAPMRVLMVDLENPAAAIAETGATLIELLRRHFGSEYNPDNLRVLERPSGIDLRTRHDRTELEREIMIQRPELVCIGPAYKMLNRRDHGRSSESHEEATDPVLRILDDLRGRHGFGLMIEHHAPQGSGGSRELRPYGSQRWMAWPEMGLTMRQEGDPWNYKIGRFRGDRLKSDWPDELHRSDRMNGPQHASSWPWIGRWSKGMSEEAF